MNDSSDQQLLRDYAAHRSEAGFTELVRRHIDLVHSAAFRMTGDGHSAKDVTQAVFVALAQNASRLTQHPVLSGWLHTAARNLAAKAIRTDVRRRRREQEAATMNELLSSAPDASWEEIAPHLDAALGELSEPDRDVVMLRYFEKKSAPEMAAVLGISDVAAQKRVNRAVERLRNFFVKRGVKASAGGLAVVISANAVQAAPAGLEVAISTAALAGTAATASVTTATANTIAMTTVHKVVVGAALVSAVVFVAFQLFRSGKSGDAAQSRAVVGPSAQADQVMGVVGNEDDSADLEGPPDPVKLLRTVARARERIQSGSVEFQYSVERYEKSGRRETNELRFVALFDGPKLRFESFGQEFSYTYDYDEAKQADIVKRADSMSREAAVQAGLLKPFSSHHVLVRDDAVLYDYWQTGNGTLRTDIDDVAKGAHSYIFDPRCSGLTTLPNVSDSVGAYLGAKQAEYVGEEDVGGTLAYHVRVSHGGYGATDYWIDKARPERLIQQADGPDITKSKYDDTNPSDPIPIEVNATRFHNGTLFAVTRLVRSAAAYNVPVDPASFTLAGLSMEVGTDVIDLRQSRSLGYWTGSGLSSNPTKPKETNSVAPPNQEDLLAWLDYNPSSPEALDSAAWIILNTPDGPMVQKAAEVILREHTRKTNLVYFCQRLERLRPSCSKMLLEAILKDNPSVEVRGNACFSLATLLKSDAKYGQNQQATAQSAKLYERVIRDFSSVKLRGYSLAELARPELYELKSLSIGIPAPDTEGVDMNGEPMKLSSYRGRVTVVVFWSGHFSEVRDYLKLQGKMAGKPFALVGVNCDDESSRINKYAEMVDWPSFRDGRRGPIAKLWNVHSWPDVWVLDRQGIIRYRDIRWGELEDAVNKLLLN